MNITLSKAVAKATDPKLRSDNWQYIIEVCDLVKEDPEDNGKEVMEIIERRLNLQDANIMLRSLSLIVSLAENCGSLLKQLISTKRFTQILYSLVQNNSIHITVKREIAKIVKQLSDSFKDDPSLKSMTDLNKKIKRNLPYLYEKPNKPFKHEMSYESRKQEDKDLEDALKLSLTEYEQQQEKTKQQQQPVYQSPQPVLQETSQQQQPSTSAGVKKVRAMYDFPSTEADELSFKKGDIIIVLEQVYRDWWRGSLRGRIGIFPLNYVTPIMDPTPHELQMAKQKESEIFGQREIVNQLHQTLKGSQNNPNAMDIAQDSQISDMYGSVTPLRPQITKMIGTYAKEKEDLVSLRQVLSSAEQTYNQLLDEAANSYRLPIQQVVQPPSYAQFSTYAGHPPMPNKGYETASMNQPYISQLAPYQSSTQPNITNTGSQYAGSISQHQAYAAPPNNPANQYSR
ncbi:hypothetical protein KAFR_0D03360 [Kazachstania africana CBS 2517]|uniref:Class E vacuolar protein-sorting machinery protein HSE1 n=1 Tax=Kazachstania africana (strain ATCC 22294 / BCRC 22015 / CBS 2517 / CECT 1963 / NBRC 1671 / NRRL Y-8276) TaxID=1071382 RepID=H2AUD4_KAZAF|nr:hypothetical protein KAFR_0D03360 [Kazachstania africana CBS 2517]CCF57984.1 hypothetical protein KAFR_0D03360 [Kazachstania africana CBS 2517]